MVQLLITVNKSSIYYSKLKFLKINSFTVSEKESVSYETHFNIPSSLKKDNTVFTRIKKKRQSFVADKKSTKQLQYQEY